MITKEELKRIKNNMRVAEFVDKQINLPTMPKGWNVTYPWIGFCKVCRKSTVSLRAIKSPGCRYYHFKCIFRSKLFIKHLAREL
jgi:hypothetical protein